MLPASTLPTKAIKDFDFADFSPCLTSFCSLFSMQAELDFDYTDDEWETVEHCIFIFWVIVYM